MLILNAILYFCNKKSLNCANANSYTKDTPSSFTTMSPDVLPNKCLPLLYINKCVYAHFRFNKECHFLFTVLF